MRRTLFQTRWLVILGLLPLLGIGGCSNVSEVKLPEGNIKTDSLEQAIAVFRKAEGMGAQNAAPKSFTKTLQAWADVKAIIQREPDNVKNIQNAIDRFAFEAEHLVHITHEIKELRSINYQAMENVVLSAEYRLLAISDALKQPDPRRQKLYDQTVTIVNAAKQLDLSPVPGSGVSGSYERPVNKNELDEARAKIKQIQIQMEGLQDANRQLDRDKRPLVARIDSLETLVVELNNNNAKLEEEIRELRSQLNKPKPVSN